MTSWKYFLTLPFSLIFTFIRELIDAPINILPHSKHKVRMTKRRLLIVRLDAIGDFILFLDTFKEYKKLYPATDWEITFLGNQTWVDLAKKLPYADQYWFIDCKKFSREPLYRYRLLKKVRQASFDVAIQPTLSRDYAVGDAVIRASNAPVRIGSAGDRSNILAWQKRRSDRWYSRLIPALDQPLMELDRNAEFIRGLGLHKFQASTPVYPIDTLSQLPQESPFIIDVPYFVIAPGAGFVEKRWSEKNFASVTESLFRRTGWTPVICGEPIEAPLAEKVTCFAPKLPWRNFVGKTTLAQMLHILNRAKLFVGNDSSAVHMAAAIGTPAVCIMGGGHFGRFFPYGNLNRNKIVYKKMDCFGCNWRCKYSKIRCIEDIEVKDVLEAVQSVLASVS